MSDSEAQGNPNTEIIEFKSGRVIDCSHYQVIDDINALFDNGVIAMIHKASEATGMIDAKFANRMTAWKGLKGSYHFLRCYGGHTGTDEAKFYLDTVKPSNDEVIALDAEAQNLTLKQLISHSELFVLEVFNQLGRYPGFYIDKSNLEEAIRKGFITEESILRHCWLWEAAYRKDLPPCPSFWDKITLHQYTDSEKDQNITLVDGDHFNGTTEELYSFWGVPQPAKADENNPDGPSIFCLLSYIL